MFTRHPFIDQFRDVRAIGFAIFGVVVLMVSWSGVHVIQSNYSLQKQISSLRQQNDIAELENANMKLQNHYFSTDEYLELAARRQFGKGAPGETLILVPKAIALAHTIPAEEGSADKVAISTEMSVYRHNFEAWRSFFFPK